MNGKRQYRYQAYFLGLIPAFGLWARPPRLRWFARPFFAIKDEEAGVMWWALFTRDDRRSA